MKKLQCELCGGALLMESESNYAACENCGMRYKKEDIKKMIVELSGPVEVKDLAKLENILTKAYDEIELREYENAYITLKKAQEIDANNTRVLLGLAALKGEPFCSRLRTIAPEISEQEKRTLISLKNRFLFMQSFYENHDRERAKYILNLGIIDGDFRGDHLNWGGRYYKPFHIICFKMDDVDFINALLKTLWLFTYTISSQYGRASLLLFLSDSSLYHMTKSIIDNHFKDTLSINCPDLVHVLMMSCKYNAKRVFQEAYNRILNLNLDCEFYDRLRVVLVLQCMDNNTFNLVQSIFDTQDMKKVSSYLIKMNSETFTMLYLAVCFDCHEAIKYLVETGAAMPNWTIGQKPSTLLEKELQNSTSIDYEDDYRSRFVRNHLKALDYLFTLYGTSFLHMACKNLNDQFFVGLTEASTRAVELLYKNGSATNVLDKKKKMPYQYLSGSLLRYLNKHNPNLYQYLVVR